MAFASQSKSLDYLAGLRVNLVKLGDRGAPGDALGYGGAMGREFLLHKGVGLQCIEQFRGIDVVARVFRKADVDHVQQREIFIAAVELDGKTVQPNPALKLDQVDRAAQEAGKLPAEIGNRAVQ